VQENHNEQVQPQSALMPAARITLPHFSVSAAMSLSKSAGEPACAKVPSSMSRALNLGSARAALISLLIFDLFAQRTSLQLVQRGFRLRDFLFSGHEGMRVRSGTV